jgi:predicted acylesterase/phospholipase RssA
MARRRGAGARIGLALAGGGPGGAAYEMGALQALEEAVAPLDCGAFDVYVGVSAGALVGACLANGITVSQLVRTLADAEPGVPPFTADVLFTPAYREFARRGATLPWLLAQAAWHMASGADTHAALRSLGQLGRVLPVALFDSDPLRRYLAGIFAQPGRSDDFRELAGRLVVVAADLASAQPIRFGEPGWEHVPVSLAVQASSALPVLYAPVRVDGRDCVDGVLLKTMHASVALERGVELLLCVNPIVPVDAAAAVRAGLLPDGLLVRRGLTAVLSQALRTMIHSRMEVGMAAYEARYPGADVVLFEPPPDEYEMFFANIFAFAPRRAVCELAYRTTRSDLRARRDELAPILARHGLSLRDDVLDDHTRTVWRAAGLAAAPPDPRGVRRSLFRLHEMLLGAEGAAERPRRRPKASR